MILPGGSASFIIWGLGLCLFLLNSCSNDPVQVKGTDHMPVAEDTVVRYNHEVVMEENQEIEDFILRYHWKMNNSGTGLRWMIYKNGKGRVTGSGEIACIKYTVRLINGDLVYRSDSIKPFEFETGKAEVPNGLEEGVLLMREGDHARLILPSHLAFGLLGDMDKIRNRAILVYDIELCLVKPGRK